MKSSKLIILDCPSAKFRLTLDTMFEKVKQDGTMQSGIYINTEKEAGTFRPSCFLVFTYVGEDYTTTKGIYLTVPHMYKLRNTVETVHNMLKDPNAFIDIEGNLSVADQYAEPVVMNGNAKNQDWLAFTISTCRSDDSLVVQKGVAIQHSKSNGMSSLLTEEEFDALYDIIMHIDFVSIENQAVITELTSRAIAAANTKPTYSKPTYNAPSRSVPNGNTYGGYRQATAAAPTYQSQTYQSPVPVGGQRPGAPQYQNVAPQSAPQQVQPQQTIPPRPATQPKVNMSNLDSIEVDIDDAGAIDSIFGDVE